MRREESSAEGGEFGYLLFPSNLGDDDCSRAAGSDNDSAQSQSVDALRRGQHAVAPVGGEKHPPLRCRPCAGEERCDS